MINLQDIIVRRGTKVVLDAASITIHPGEKAALIGRNGAGKSTLFSLLTGGLIEDGGRFSFPKSWRISQVEQHMPETDASATDYVLAGDTLLAEAQAALDAADLSGDGAAIGAAHAALADAGAFDAKSRAQTLILGLGFQVNELDRPVNAFSGGWRMRLQLARALMCPADLLLLDEPTNHLDLDALVWLEAWLKRFDGTMLVISHDREFLDAVTRVTVHLDQAKLTRYGGNYSTFEELRSQQLTLQHASFSKQQDRIAHLQSFISRFKAKASKAKQAQSRVKALERMEKIAPVLAAADFTFEFKEPDSLPNPMITIRNAVVGYSDDSGATTPIVSGITRSVVAGQRIGLLGANGQGKSTLVKTIAGSIKALSGEFTEGKGLSIGYFAQQELDVLRTDDTPLEHMVRLSTSLGTNAREQELRDFLGSFRFIGDMVGQAVGTMSGGEKARLVLAMVVYQRPNLLLLDEPTNHLDLTTREALAMALNEFEGTVMLVSHDRALLRSVCDDFWLVTHGALLPFDGDLDDYQTHLLEEAKRKRESITASSAPQRATESVGRGNQAQYRKEQAAKRQAIANQVKPLQKRLEAIEKEIADAEVAQQKISQMLLDNPDRDAIMDMGKRAKVLETTVATLEEEWLAVTESIETMKGKVSANA
ncbi:MAG: ATP-binding cassette domain-containing protein [Burkholderiaceae bacterium]|jgi:ATP-binding cassette, subfamily F, member 3|nr:ATP-binding cassette domain-containing protein [Burkholderiaceae bacterium]MDO7680782.1 ATP-binding cassette domain-containing protein [Burkholderiaceae bacterium]MDO7692436.1 ATP-binding cassette domain-containing protein [Burkholderiaceae bacterium]MDO7717757.1 ATP-binding cassette domain-containing protein [Burkholderiaceae bacterium]MDP4697631.1 ATP-binding cassette domain-containing protein [Burkholderiaceae bacterium]